MIYNNQANQLTKRKYYAKVLLYARWPPTTERSTTRRRWRRLVHLYNYILLAGFVCLLFNRESRFAASVFLFGWAVYLSVTIDGSNTTYYAASATIETCIAYVLNKRFRVVSWLGYSLLILNFVGLLVHNDDLGRYVYSLLYALISVAQFLLLLARAIPNGLNRLHSKHFMVRIIDFDSRGSYVRMYKNTTKKG